MADALFYKYSKKGVAKYVPTSDALEGPVADTHAHLDMLPDPALSVAKAAIWGVDFIVSITDPTEKEGQTPRWDGRTSAEITYAHIAEWFDQGVGRIDQVVEDTVRALGAQRDAAAAAGTPFGEDPTGDEQTIGLLYQQGVRIPTYRLACGVHPHNARLYTPVVERRLREYLADPRTCAVGEAGLDYYYDLSPREVQRDVFKRQIALAHETGLPMVLHVRDAHDDAYRILRQEGFPAGGVLLHCCSVDPKDLGKWTEAGCFVAFGGSVSFANAENVRKDCRATPADLLLTETDAPYMAPVPLRGVTCEPHFTNLNARAVCDTIGYPAGPWRKALLENMYSNAQRLLNRPPTPWQMAVAGREVE